VPPGPVPFGDLLEMLSDAHDRQVRGLEAAAATARELLAQSRRQGPPVEPELEEAGDVSLPGAVVSARRRSQKGKLTQLREGTEPPVPPGAPRSPNGRVSQLRELAQQPSCSQDAAGLLDQEVAEVTDSDPKKEMSSVFDSSRSVSRWRLELDKMNGLDTFIDKLSETDNRLDDGRRARLAYKIVKTVYFDSLSYALIVANSIFIGASMKTSCLVPSMVTRAT